MNVSSQSIVRFIGAEYPFYLSEGSDGNSVEGFYGVYWLEVTRRLNIKFTYIINPHLQYGVVTSEENGTGIIGNLLRNESDVSLIPMNPTQEIFPYVKLSATIKTMNYRLFSIKPIDEENDMFAALDVFSDEVWISWFLSFVYFCCFNIWFHKSKFFQFYYRKLYAPRRIIWVALSTLLSKSGNLKILNIGDRICWGAWIYASFCLTSAFTSCMLSKITRPVTKRYLESLADLLKIPTMKVVLVEGTTFHYELKHSKDQIKRQVWDQVMRWNGTFDPAQYNMINFFDELQEGRASLILPESVAILAFRRIGFNGPDQEEPVFFFPMVTLFESQFSWVFRKGFDENLRLRICKLALWTFEHKSLDHPLHMELWDGTKYFPKSFATTSTEGVAIGMEKLYLATTLMILGVIISWITLVVEVFMGFSKYW